MLGIPDNDQRREIAEYIAYQQVLSAERMGYKHKDMARLLQRDWQLVSMAKETMTNLVRRLQSIVTALKKNPGNRSSTLATIKQYWGRALYDRFENIDKALGSDKFFHRLGTVVRRYKSRQMLVAIQALNNIIAHRLLTARRGSPSDSYRYQTTNDFEKLLNLEDKKNTSMITVQILLVLRMHIGPTRFLEVGAPNAKYDADERLRTGFISLDWDDSAVAEAIAAVEDNEDEEEDPLEKNRQLRREKQCQKRAAKAKTRVAKAKTCQ